jgi:phospholipid N-methyltransferase
MSRSHFFREFIHNWKTIGAISPSSPQLARTLCEAAHLSHCHHVLELGPGTGAITHSIHQLKHQHCRYLGLELNAPFVTKLKCDYPQFHFEQADAQNFDFSEEIQLHGSFDAIISGLPWAAFPPDLQEGILNNILPHLRPNSRFVTFAYSGFHLKPAGIKFYQKLRHHFKHVEKSPIIWANLPPAFVYSAWNDSVP